MSSLFGILLFIGGVWVLIRITRRLWIFRGRVLRHLIVVYLALLLLSVPLLYLVPEAKVDTDRRETMRQLQESSNLFKEAIQQGQLPSEKHMRELHSWDFRYEHAELAIVPDNWEDNIWVLVKKNPDLSEGEVRVTYYSTPYFYVEGGIDFTHLLKPPVVVPEGDKLIVSYLKPSVKVDLIKFRPVSHLQPFTGKDPHPNSQTVIWGEELLYLEVPEQLTIHANNEIKLKYMDE